ncbi:transcriptional regulator [Burkholderia vietnamiensis]|jgi:prophage regulatory protein|uniref:AlpA family transcriptional regulator n=1 Tax=Burkholderia cepacia complex TaxID=87882 RepID=UPI00076186B9|nr:MULTISPECIES: AlpA family transcriptional regulator [Burkholderia cepacia complex]KVS36284.1 transcriptional regulator [Burkholderia vietnamiensis]
MSSQTHASATPTESAVAEPAPVEHRILRRAEVEAKTGFKRAHLYALMKQGKFPKAMRLGVRAIGWDSVEIDQWITDRLKERD